MPTEGQFPEPLVGAIWSMWGQAERKPRMRMIGNSMSPFINEDDILLIDPKPKTIRIGDVVIYRREGKCIAHRVVGIKKSKPKKLLLLKGDNVFGSDPPVPGEMVIGKVLGKENASNKTDYTTMRWLVLNPIMAVVSMLVGRSHIFYRIFRRLCRLLLRGLPKL